MRTGHLEIRPYQPSDEQLVVELWELCDLVRPWNNPWTDIARKLSVGPDLFLVGVIGDRIIATVMAGYEGHRGWINYLAVAPDARRKGVGRSMLEEAEKCLRDVGCPKINLQIRRSNGGVMAFYAAMGYDVDDVISMGKRLELDEGKT
jgi:ribosomal protein S18 acetylase RimI-like enzyme